MNKDKSINKNKLNIIIASISVVIATIVGVVVYFALQPTPNTHYLYFKQDSLTLDLYQEVAVDEIELNTSIIDKSSVVYTTKGDCVEIVDNILVAKSVGSDTLTCTMTYKGKEYKSTLDLLVKFDGISSVLQVSVDATKQDSTYVLYLPNKNYTKDDVNNCADIDIIFTNSAFESDITYQISSTTTAEQKEFNSTYSFDNDVVEIAEHKVKAVGLGSAEVTIHFVDTNLSTKVYFVVKQILPTSISVSGGDMELSLAQGIVSLPTVNILPVYATVTDYTISILDTSIVNIYNDSYLQPLTTGSTKATFSCGELSTTINIVVSAQVDKISVNILEDFVSNSLATIEFALLAGSTEVDGEVGVMFIVDGEEVAEVESVYYYEISNNTIDFDLGELIDFTIRIYYTQDISIYYDIEIVA